MFNLEHGPISSDAICSLEQKSPSQPSHAVIKYIVLLDKSSCNISEYFQHTAHLLMLLHGLQYVIWLKDQLPGLNNQIT